MTILRTILAMALLGVGSAMAQAQETATATMMSPDGANLGAVTLLQTPHGVLLTAELTGLPPGVHAFHLHAVGGCTPDFGMAGGHYNPTEAEHGILVEGGPHAGDMPNIHVPESGNLTIEVLNTFVSLSGENPLFDDDGTSVMIHAGADDYASQPSGAAGDRIACGVVEH